MYHHVTTVNPRPNPVFVTGGLTTIDVAWAFVALADECIGERTCNVCSATPGQPCRPELHRGSTK
jgi:hypothetical protein